jgi:hypothetical protein
MCKRATALLCAIVACRGETPGPDDRPSPADPKLYLSPTSIDFGRVNIGETATTSITLRNYGDEDIVLDGLFPSSDTLVVDDVGSFGLAPGEEQVRTVRWTPAATYTLDEQLDVIVVPSPPATIEVPVTGSPVFGALRMPWGSQDFGSVPVGCDREVTVRISNEGVGDLTLRVTLSGADELTMTAFWPGSGWQTGAQTEGVLGQADYVDLNLRFVPTTPGSSSEATLHVESDDLVRPVVDTTLTALAADTVVPTSLSWDVEPRPTTFTGLIDVNADVAADLRDAFGSFFDVLRASAIPFRVAIIGNESADLDPSVAGPYAYIDQTFSAEDTDEAVGAMLDGIEGDEDRGLALLESAIADHRDWLLDEDPRWQSSTLHLTVINVDFEQSPAPADYYVDQYEEYKDAAAWIVVNGIAGRPPMGCATGKFAAVPSLPLLDASLQTGGVFLSICDDPSTNLGLLAEHMVRPMFPLGNPPVDANITVTVDGKEIDSGWVYDPQTNAIRFDDDSYPVAGSVVGIEYGAVTECD